MANSTAKVKVWDVYIRIFHWLLLICILVSFISFRLDEMDIHFISGHCVLALLIFRVIWGVIGSRTALFHTFIKGPGAILNYVKNPSSEKFKGMIGHSPIAALSVIAMLVVISVQVGTGLISDDEILLQGPLAKYVSGDMSYQATTYHGINAKLIIGLIVLHLAAIAFYRFIKKDDIVKPMVIGQKEVTEDYAEKAPPLDEKKLIVAAMAILVSIAIAYLVFNA
ncbi:MAG: cytochrome b/b6 domain-containing protein [Lentilitoribacter sp.]